MDVDELDIDKLKTAPIDLKKFSDVVEKDVVKKVLIELGKKVNIIYSDKQNPRKSTKYWVKKVLFNSAL